MPLIFKWTNIRRFISKWTHVHIWYHAVKCWCDRSIEWNCLKLAYLENRLEQNFAHIPSRIIVTKDQFNASVLIRIVDSFTFYSIGVTSIIKSDISIITCFVSSPRRADKQNPTKTSVDNFFNYTCSFGNSNKWTTKINFNFYVCVFRKYFPHKQQTKRANPTIECNNWNPQNITCKIHKTLHFIRIKSMRKAFILC